MSAHRYIDRICCAALACTLILTLLFLNGEALGVEKLSQVMGYEARLFDTGTVHTLDILMDDWEGFIDTCTNEEYSPCSVVIDKESFENIGIRAKGNTSLTQVESYRNDRYSFKLEFDHYETGKSYHGLDKLSLNNIIQDNTYMKDYITYRLMADFGAAAPLCSYVYIRVNGEDWGLYLAVEGIEDAFLQRNYSSDYGELYKPDSQSFGGGRGNGGGFQMEDWQAERTAGDQNEASPPNIQEKAAGDMPDFGSRPENMPNQGDMPEGMPDRGEKPEGAPGQGDIPERMPEQGDFPEGAPDFEDIPERFGDGFPGRGGFGGMNGSSDVSLIYTDDEYSSYQNIFDNAKTEITDQDRDRLIASLKKLNNGEDIAETVDVEQVIRYFVVHNFVCNFDSYTGSMIHNYYLYESGGQLSMLPWDYNLAFGGFMGAQDATALVNYPIDTPVSGGTIESRPMLAWIFADETYTQMYHEYFQEFLSQCFDSGAFSQEIDQVRKLIAPYVEKDPTKFCQYEEFEAGVSTLKEFCLLRAESIAGQLDGSIPSTSEGQSGDSSALIDASHIEIDDMGTMNQGFGGDRGGFRMNQPREDGSSAQEPSAPPEEQDVPEGGRNIPAGGRLGENEAASSPNIIGNGLMTIVCILVLAGGIGILLAYKKRV